MLSKAEHIQLLFELAMSVGTSLDLKQMLRKSLMSIMSKINCAGSVVLFVRKDGTGSEYLTPVFSIPRNIDKKEDYQKVLNVLPVPEKDDDFEKFAENLPFSGKTEDKKFFHVMNLPGLGCVILLKNNVDIDPLIIKSLDPIFSKLSNACNACLQNEELMEHRNNLEKLVRIKSEEILTKNGQLKKEISERKQVEEAYKISEEDYRLIFDSTGDAIIVLEKERGLIINVNRKALDVFAIGRKEELLNSTIAALGYKKGSETERMIKKHFELAEKESPQTFEWQIVNRKNEVIWVEINLKKVSLRGRDRILAIIHDINERKLASEKLEKALEDLKRINEELKEANASKDKFFSIISHDLRGPFTILTSYAKILKENYEKFDREKVTKGITNIYKSARKIHTLMENLLTWSYLQKDSLRYSPAKADVKNIIETSVSLAAPLADQKNIKLETSVRRKTYAYCDVNMTGTIIRNLLSNAIKYTENNGSVKVSAKDAGEEVIISVSDTGVGIPQESIPRLFRIDAYNKVRWGPDQVGTGLGLILCKELVDKNGGRIEVESEAGKGTKISFTLPSFSVETESE